jgi:hypothetical protein
LMLVGMSMCSQDSRGRMPSRTGEIEVLITVVRASFKLIACPFATSLTWWFSNATAEMTLSASVLIPSTAFADLSPSHLSTSPSVLLNASSHTSPLALSLKHGATIFLCRGQSSPLLVSTLRPNVPKISLTLSGFSNSFQLLSTASYVVVSLVQSTVKPGLTIKKLSPSSACKELPSCHAQVQSMARYLYGSVTLPCLRQFSQCLATLLRDHRNEREMMFLRHIVSSSYFSNIEKYGGRVSTYHLNLRKTGLNTKLAMRQFNVYGVSGLTTIFKPVLRARI